MPSHLTALITDSQKSIKRNDPVTYLDEFGKSWKDLARSDAHQMADGEWRIFVGVCRGSVGLVRVTRREV